MSERILSISGLRGVVGDGLNPDYVVRFAQAVGLFAKRGLVVVGRDGRSTGMMLKHAVLAGLESVGCRVVDLGIASTPSCGFVVRALEAAAGLQITASHNPIEWNGLKPFSKEGSVFDERAGRKLLELLESPAVQLADWKSLGRVDALPEAADAHLNAVLALIEGETIRRRRLNVVLDCNHGSGAVLGPRLLEALGCQVTVLGGSADGRFDHPPEPLKANLGGLCDAVRRNHADAGFAQDPDADRLAIVDNTGRYIGEELTLALCADFVLSRRPGPLVVNGSTSRVTADVAARYKAPFHRAAVGEAHVVAKMRSVSAVFGGEGNGGVIEPQVGYVRDSFVAMAYILAGLAASQRTLAEWADSLPRYAIVKDKLVCPRNRVGAAAAALRANYRDAAASEGDGLRLDWPDRWVQVRASNTEPIVRIIAEAPDERSAAALCSEAIALVRRAVSRSASPSRRKGSKPGVRNAGTKRKAPQKRRARKTS